MLKSRIMYLAVLVIFYNNTMEAAAAAAVTVDPTDQQTAKRVGIASQPLQGPTIKAEVGDLSEFGALVAQSLTQAFEKTELSDSSYEQAIRLVNKKYTTQRGKNMLDKYLATRKHQQQFLAHYNTKAVELGKQLGITETTIAPLTTAAPEKIQHYVNDIHLTTYTNLVESEEFQQFVAQEKRSVQTNTLIPGTGTFLKLSSFSDIVLRQLKVEPLLDQEYKKAIATLNEKHQRKDGDSLLRSFLNKDGGEMYRGTLDQTLTTIGRQLKLTEGSWLESAAHLRTIEGDPVGRAKLKDDCAKIAHAPFDVILSSATFTTYLEPLLAQQSDETNRKKSVSSPKARSSHGSTVTVRTTHGSDTESAKAVPKVDAAQAAASAAASADDPKLDEEVDMFAFIRESVVSRGTQSGAQDSAAAAAAKLVAHTAATSRKSGASASSSKKSKESDSSAGYSHTTSAQQSAAASAAAAAAASASSSGPLTAITKFLRLSSTQPASPKPQGTDVPASPASPRRPKRGSMVRGASYEPPHAPATPKLAGAQGKK